MIWSKSTSGANWTRSFSCDHQDSTDSSSSAPSGGERATLGHKPSKKAGTGHGGLERRHPQVHDFTGASNIAASITASM